MLLPFDAIQVWWFYAFRWWTEDIEQASETDWMRSTRVGEGESSRSEVFRFPSTDPKECCPEYLTEWCSTFMGLINPFLNRLESLICKTGITINYGNHTELSVDGVVSPRVRCLPVGWWVGVLRTPPSPSSHSSGTSTLLRRHHLYLHCSGC